MQDCSQVKLILNHQPCRGREEEVEEEKDERERESSSFWLHKGMDFYKNQTKRIKLILILFTILIYMDKDLITTTSPKDTN